MRASRHRNAWSWNPPVGCRHQHQRDGDRDLFPMMASSPQAPVWVRPNRPIMTRANLFLAAAILGFPVVAAFVAVAAPRLPLLQHRSMPVLAANHLVTLGWATMVALGALQQLLPAAAGVRRDPSAVGTLQFVL